MSGCDRELNAHFYSAASLTYHAPDISHDTTSSHIILTLCRPVLALPRKSECQARSNCSTIFNDFGMSRPGIEPVTFRSPQRTFYLLSFRGRSSEREYELNILYTYGGFCDMWAECQEERILANSACIFETDVLFVPSCQ